MEIKPAMTQTLHSQRKVAILIEREKAARAFVLLAGPAGH
jgi:hypothetical protein